MSDTNQTHPNSRDQNGYLLPRRDYTLETSRGANPAADVIRDKLARIYDAEPDAAIEETEAEAAARRSKHQQFMYELNNSGLSLAQIQIDWHNYYIGLPDDEKHQVWQEFYASNEVTKTKVPSAAAAPKPTSGPSEAEQLATIRNQLVAHAASAKQAREERRSAKSVKQNIRRRSNRPTKLTAKHHLQSLIFGVSMGLLAVIVFLFGFFNEVVIAPFIQPGRADAATPVIITQNSIAPTSSPEVIIPKINVEIPVNYSETSTDETTIENDLESGIVHYPTTSMPGQNGNAAFFGHSSNNIFNPGKYKFAFVLLHELVPGDTFYLTNGGKIYAYKVFSKTIVDPSDVGVLNPVDGHQATATLITCDPPGTSLHRLVVVGDQISPDPSGNSNSTTAEPASPTTTTQLAGNGQTLWGRFIGSGIGKTIVGLLVVAAVIIGFRRLSRGKR